MKVGIASTDWATSITLPDGSHPWGGAGWVRLGQYIPGSRHDITAGGLIRVGDEFGVMDHTGYHHFGFDVIIMQRNMFADMPEHMNRARANGQILVNDVDDWYWGLDTTNGAYAASHPKNNPDENTVHYARVCNASTAVITSTPYLAERLSRFVRDCPIEIIENHVEVDRFDAREHTASVPTVGWVGSTAHRSRDLEILRGVLVGQLGRGEIRLHHSGHHPNHASFASRLLLAEEQVETFPLVPPDEYPSALCFDIGLAPLNDIPFNHAKSWIKAIEYASAGIPFIASDLPEYRRLHDLYGIGRLAKRPTHWQNHVRQLLDPAVRTEEAARQREAVRALDLSIGQKIWDDFLESLT